MRLRAVLIVMLLVARADAETAVQSDWSGGPGGAAPVNHWTSDFDSFNSVSWLAVPGQLALASEVLDEPEEVVVSAEVDGPCSVFPADLDGDGGTDILATALDGGEVAWWRRHHDGTWTKQVVRSGLAEPISVHAADLDGDGDADVAAAMWTAHEIRWWRNDGGDPVVWTERLVVEGLFNPHWVSSADVDSDGDLDLLGAFATSDAVAWWRNDGGEPIVWTAQLVDDTFDGSRAVEGGDIDNDGDTDLVGVAYLSHEVAWWSNDGGEPIVWSKHTISDSLPGSHGVALADLDLDGSLDVLTAAYDSHDISWWRNQGGDPVAWTLLPVDEVFPGALTAVAADVDGDGDVDVLGAGELFAQVALWSSDGSNPPVWTKSVLASRFRGAWPVHVADLDGDGDLDPFAGARSDNLVTLWRATRFVAEGQLVSRVLDTGGAMYDARCGWIGRLSDETSISVSIRAGDEPDDLGTWSEVDGGWLPAHVTRGRRYLQYRIILTTSNPEVSPILEEISFTWLDQDATRVPRHGGGRIEP